ncbi:MAG: AAA family ATPase, partial [Nitriliruptorales bacterium]|nr:AAA family ATPase [Nitriliruptorales bacterium]
MADDAALSGGLVLSGQCWDGDGAPAYWPWVQVLRAGIEAGGNAGAAARLLPEDPVEGPAAGLPPAEDRFRLFDAVASFLARLAHQRHVVVVLDDVHWADEGSLRLLEFAAHHLTAHPVLLLAVYRDEEAGPLLRRLAAVREQVHLTALPQAEVMALMAAVTGTSPPQHVAENVWRRTGGNPFLVRELTRLLVAQGSYTEASVPVPVLLASVRDILERRLARLSQRCVDLLTVAAVTGPEVRLHVLARTVDEPASVPVLVDEAVAARVLHEPPAPADAYRFSHDLFRETILAGMAADQRIGLHLTVGRALESLAAEGAVVHPAELAAHFGAAVTAAPSDAVRYGMLAGEQAISRLAFEEARAHYERVLSALDLIADGSADQRLDVLLRLGATRNQAGDAPAARSAYRDAAELARAAGDATSLARAALGVHA